MHYTLPVLNGVKRRSIEVYTTNVLSNSCWSALLVGRKITGSLHECDVRCAICDGAWNNYYYFEIKIVLNCEP